MMINRSNSFSNVKIIMFVLCLFAVAGLMYSPAPVQADITPPHDTPILIVGATGTVTAAPDQARISLAVTNIDQNLTKAQNMNNKATQDVISALLKTGVNKNDIQTLNYNVYPQYDYNTKVKKDAPPEIIGYRIRNEISVVVKNIDSLGNVLDTAVKAGANNVNYINFEKADISLQENEALAKAVTRARSKAEAIAAAAGMSLGNVVKITEGGMNTILPGRDMYFNEKAISMKADSQVPINPGDLKVTTSIYITYELK